MGSAGGDFGGAQVAEYVPVAPLTTLRVGPVARRLITCTTTEQIVATVRALDRSDGPMLVLGGGSNVVIADDVDDLTVVRLATTAVTIDGSLLRAQAGADWDTVVVRALGADLGGLECLSGIPGSAGATPVQNVGAYGTEVADLITRVRLLDRRTAEVDWVPAAALEFGYRHSVLKNTDHAVVLEVEFAIKGPGEVGDTAEKFCGMLAEGPAHVFAHDEFLKELPDVVGAGVLGRLENLQPGDMHGVLP